jgi:hypothetical protein
MAATRARCIGAAALLARADLEPECGSLETYPLIFCF